MVKSGHRRPAKLIPDKKNARNRIDNVHWTSRLNEVVVKSSTNWKEEIEFGGGSNVGEFIYVTKVNNVNYVTERNKLHVDDIILEVDKQKVSGFTGNDIIIWLEECFKNPAVTFEVVSTGACIPKSLHQLLSLRFEKGSVDHKLQNIVRDNLYLRTVPVTTRKPRDYEVDGVDYTFLTVEKFIELERSGDLIESGVHEGNRYGTPKPSNYWYLELERKYNNDNPNVDKSNSATTLSGLHPSSEGKRKRNRSNVEAMASKNINDDDDSVQPSSNDNPTDIMYQTGSPPSYFHRDQSTSFSYELDENDGLGPLPPKWEKAFTEKGEVYFIDHNSSTSHWLDPRLSRIQKKSLEDCAEDELPFGWERIDDPLYGTYYIDHVNRQTQYENPVIQAKCNRNGSNMTSTSIIDKGPSYNTALNCSNYINKNLINDNSDNYGNFMDNSNFDNGLNERPYIFTTDPNKLVGERIRSTIVKSYKGLGFTIVGGGDTKDEFLQIKSIVKNGPAWCEGKLQTGDVLVYMNNKCVLGYTHQDMVNVFQSIAPGETVELEVCRGYILPFDPNDPNTEVVTTVAVGNNTDSADRVFMEKDVYLKRNLLDPAGLNNDLTNLSMKSTSDLYSSEKVLNVTRPTSVEFIVDDEDTKPRYLTMSIVKGVMGFGFTIADSAYGQKVKKILDKQRCKLLMEGDILVEINNLQVRNMCHSEVVQVLKDCPRNLEATITVERINYGLPPNNNSNSSEGVTTAIDNDKDNNANIAVNNSNDNNNNSGFEDVNIINNGSVSGVTTNNNNVDNDCGAANNGGGRSNGAANVRLMMTTMKKKPDVRLNTAAIDLRNNNHHHHHLVQQQQQHHHHHQKSLPSPPSALDDIQSQSQSQSPRIKTPVILNLNLNLVDPLKCANNNNNNNNNRNSNSNNNNNTELLYDNEINNSPQTCYSRSQSPGNGLDSNDMLTTADTAGINNTTWYRQTSQQEQQQHYSNAISTIANDYNNGGAINNNQIIHNNRVCLDYNNSNDGSYYYSPVLPSSMAVTTADLQQHNKKKSTSFEHVQPLPNTMEMRSYRPLPSDNMDMMNHRESEILESVVTIYRQEAGFGFRIVGGTEEGSQVSIGHIVEGGAAEKDGRLQSGDEIISVDNELVINSSHHRVVQLMGKAAVNGKVSLRIRRKFVVSAAVSEPYDVSLKSDRANHNGELIINNSSSAVSSDVKYPYDVVVRRHENEGFGFVIISSLNKAGSTIGRIMEGSPAERCGQLHLGDQIIAVNHVNILNLHHGDIVNLIKDSGYAVTLTIGPPLDDSSSTTSIPLSHKEDETDDTITTTTAAAAVDNTITTCTTTNTTTQFHDVIINRGSRGFGFSIRGGKEFHNMDLFVLQIAENGPAAINGRLKVGDKLIEINGISTKHMTHAQAIEIIRNGGASVRLLVQRGGKVPPLPTEDQMMGSLSQSSSSGSASYSNDNTTRQRMIPVDKPRVWDTRLPSS